LEEIWPPDMRYAGPSAYGHALIPMNQIPSYGINSPNHWAIGRCYLYGRRSLIDTPTSATSAGRRSLNDTPTVQLFQAWHGPLAVAGSVPIYAIEESVGDRKGIRP